MPRDEQTKKIKNEYTASDNMSIFSMSAVSGNNKGLNSGAVIIEGTVENIIFRNESNGYAICEIKAEQDQDTVTVVGYLPFINEGEILRVTGRWVYHPDYGEQIRAESFEKVMPSSLDAIERYLGSGAIKGVGPATARKIVERFGKDTLAVIENTPARLAEIRGITADKALKIGQAFAEQKGFRNVLLFLQEYGINTIYASRIYKAFGEASIEVIRDNPYKLVDEVFGIGFKTADQIAQSLGIDPQSPYRIASGIKYVLSQAVGNGHTYLPREKLSQVACGLLDVPEELIDGALTDLVLDNSIRREAVGEEERIYLTPFYHAETGVARKLMELSSVRFQELIPDMERRLEQFQKSENIQLADEQYKAVCSALKEGVLVITGGPGTGKTTIIKSIIYLLHSEGFRVELAAPTGRAAKRMTEATGFEARTIHRMLEIGYTGDEEEPIFNRGEDNPLDADVIIIDECSMVDILLMNNLLKAVEPGTRLILVGDVDQLPPVGAGNVLKDIINSGMIPVVKLTEVFRQAQESMIIVNAHKVNRGEDPELNVKGKDFYFVQRYNVNDALFTITDLCKNRLPAYYGCDPMRSIQVLAPTKKGPLGVQNLNIQLQEALNPSSSTKAEKPFRDYVFRVGDRVMQVKNNYQLRWEKWGQPYIDGTGVFNGDLGIILAIDDDERKIQVLFDDERVVDYDYGILDELDLAYAVTVHKSQGSEFPIVVMPVFSGPPMLLTRNLLYTAITRAKELVVLVGNPEAARAMVRNNREMMRYSGLIDKLRRV